MLLLFFAIFAAGSCLAAPREWESADGRKIVAELVSYDADSGKVLIRRLDGTEFTLSQDKLSEGDRTFLTGYAKRRDEETAAEGKQAAAVAGKTIAHDVPGDPKAQFHVYHPTGYGKKGTMPMLILFSPGGSGPGMVNAFRDAAEECGWIVVGCGYLSNNTVDKVAHEVFTRMLPLIEKAVPLHDPERLYLGGMSGGASRAFMNTALFKRPWKGVISCGGWLGAEPERAYPKHMAVAFVNGDDDRGANSYVVRDTEILERKRAKCKLFEFPGGHVIGPKPVLVEAMKWVEAETRN